MLITTAGVGIILALSAFVVPSQLSNGGYIAEGTEATRTETLLNQRFDAGIPDLVLYVRAQKPTDDPEVMRAGRDFTRRVTEQPGVGQVLSYWTVADRRLVSEDGRAALVTVDLRGDEDAAARRAAGLVPRLTGEQGMFTVTATGPAWVMAQATELSREELIRAELIGAPLAVLVLLFAFGSITAALLPAVVGALAVAGTFAVLQVLATYMPLSVFAFNITTALGFGLAVDYGLFVVSRYREELAVGVTPPDAIETTMRTAGRTVLFSAGTVVVCLAALLLFPLGFLRSLGLAGISVVVLAAAVTRLVLPAMLLVIGRRIDRLDPFASLRRSGRADRSRLWTGLARLATGRPVLAGACAVLFLLALTVPFAHARFGVTDERVLPEKTESHATAARIGDEFPLPWTRTLAVLLLDTDVVDQHDDLDAYARKVSALPTAGEVGTALGTYRDGHRTSGPSTDSLIYITNGSTWLSVIADGPPSADEPLVRELRALPSPGRHFVSGRPARVLDTKNAVLGALPTAAATVVGAVLLLLFLFTGSVLIPVKAVIMGALSLSASFGAMVYVFQDGHLRALVGHFTVTGELETSMPILVFGAAFALSVDYELFLISRIQEEYRRTGDHKEAVVTGLARTGRMITVAAVIFAVALLPLVSSAITLLKLVGCGLALAVLVDATVVRGVLVPSFMQLTGHANWWAPRPLAALHRRIGADRWHHHIGPPTTHAGLPAARDSEPATVQARQAGE
ncbi:MMPL family transporter [Streptomyces sp. G44]|uniref:MMPL family transporter n=1 Tax=Streptomyces sp. G44 TaxID=2807632 RepID=UPI00195F91F6|nr:MMPL family transporter [Streptomyces sp. G44]MBM7167748.1 MMPL family transporter [Streptomyces sp. G44]